MTEGLILMKHVKVKFYNEVMNDLCGVLSARESSRRTKWVLQYGMLLSYCSSYLRRTLTRSR